MPKNSFGTFLLLFGGLMLFTLWCKWLLDYPVPTLGVTFGAFITCSAIDEKRKKKNNPLPPIHFSRETLDMLEQTRLQEQVRLQNLDRKV